MLKVSLTLHAIESSEDDDGIHIVSSYRIKNDLKLDIEYHFKSQDEILVREKINFRKKDLPELPRFGLLFSLNKKLDKVKWFGRGPHDNYQDRKTSALFAEYRRDLKEFYFSYERPQETGNKEDVYYAEFENSKLGSIEFVGTKQFSFSALPYSVRQLEKVRHKHELKDEGKIYVQVDYAQTGVGGDTSWGLLPLDKYQVKAKDMSFEFSIKI